MNKPSITSYSRLGLVDIAETQTRCTACFTPTLCRYGWRMSGASRARPEAARPKPLCDKCAAERKGL